MFTYNCTIPIKTEMYSDDWKWISLNFNTQLMANCFRKLLYQCDELYEKRFSSITLDNASFFSRDIVLHDPNNPSKCTDIIRPRVITVRMTFYEDVDFFGSDFEIAAAILRNAVCAKVNDFKNNNFSLYERSTNK